MKRIIVTGSHRAHESQYLFDPNMWELFVRSCKTLGGELAQAGYDLLLCWSEKNLDSQVGIKSGYMVHPDSHPYWETADYQTLLGFLLEMNSKRAATRVKIFVSKHEYNERYGLFPDPMIYANEKGVEVRTKLASMPDADQQEFVKEKLLDNSTTFINRKTLPDSMLRSEILPQILPECDVAIIMGGGKATSHFIREAHTARKLVTIAPSCKSSFSNVEAKAFERAGAVNGIVTAIAKSAKGDLIPTCKGVVANMHKIRDILDFDLTRNNSIISNSGSLEADDKIEKIYCRLRRNKKNLSELNDVMELFYILSRICVGLYSTPYFSIDKKEIDFNYFLALQFQINPSYRDYVYLQGKDNGGIFDLSYKKIPIEVKVVDEHGARVDQKQKRAQGQAACYGVTSRRRISFLCILDLTPKWAIERLPENCFQLERAKNGDPVIVIRFSGKFLPPSQLKP